MRKLFLILYLSLLSLCSFGQIQMFLAGSGGGGANPMYPLDSVGGASAAYALIPLSSSFENADLIEVRESGGDTYEWFTRDETEDGTLIAFCGANDGFVRTLVDQSGNGVDVTQATTSKQPQIVSSGVLITRNGEPSMFFDGVDDELLGSSITIQSLFVVAENSALNAANYPLGVAGNSGVLWGGTSASVPGITLFDGIKTVTSTVEDLFEHLADFMCSTENLYVDGVFKNSSTFASALIGGVSIGSRNGLLYHKGYIKAAILYPDDQAANSGQIRTIINNIYSIY